MQTMEMQKEAVWDYIRNRLFLESTNLVYDCFSSTDQEARFDHLPWPDEIAADFPNPCGWGTGMEDCMLNAGSVMEICRLRYRFQQDPEALRFACRILEGMFACTHVHGTPGFVARGISPRDGKSCYSNSSRDQFTLCVYGAWNFLRGFPDAPENARQTARRILTDVADYCERSITPANSYDLMRLDGKPGLVGKMMHVQCHEELRLPMIYLAAYDVSGEKRYLDHYLSLRETALKTTRRPNEKKDWWDISIGQLQISLDLCGQIDSDTEPEYRNLRASVREIARQHLENILKQVRDFRGDWNLPCADWRLQPMAQHHDAFDRTRGIVTLFQGKPYLCPKANPEYKVPATLLRATGNLLIALLLGTEGKAHPLAEEAALIVMKPDFSRHCSSGGINLLHGISLLSCR